MGEMSSVNIVRGKRVVEVRPRPHDSGSAGSVSVAIVYGNSALTAVLDDEERRRLIQALGGEVK